jgi:hypothetical protein
MRKEGTGRWRGAGEKERQKNVIYVDACVHQSEIKERGIGVTGREL